MDNKRLKFLDGMRGLAILVVLLFHAYARWPDIVPYGSRFANIPIFSFGWLGVQLFFLISGFVIVMTLEKCINFKDFMLRRWFRLFPAMFICSVIVFMTASFFFERPAGSPVIRDLLPGLSFIEPSWWRFFLGSPQGMLEGAFWSLFVEVKFYIIAGSLFFLIGRKNTIFAIFSLFFISVVLTKLQNRLPGIDFHIPLMFMQIISAGHFGWFSAGALFYIYLQEKKPSQLYLAMAVGLLSAVVTGGFKLNPSIAATGVLVIFAGAVLSPKIQCILSVRFFGFLGLISYPLYLVHENMMVSLIIKTGHYAPWIPDLFIPVFPVLIVVGVGAVVALYLEPWLREKIRPAYLQICTILGVKKLSDNLSKK